MHEATRHSSTWMCLVPMGSPLFCKKGGMSLSKIKLVMSTRSSYENGKRAIICDVNIYKHYVPSEPGSSIFKEAIDKETFCKAFKPNFVLDALKDMSGNSRDLVDYKIISKFKEELQEIYSSWIQHEDVSKICNDPLLIIEEL